MPGLTEVTKLARREREERLVSEATPNVRRATEKNDRDLLAHRNMELTMQRPALVRALHLRDPLLDMMGYCHDLFSSSLTLAYRVLECFA
jgi:hypothetical protein